MDDFVAQNNPLFSGTQFFSDEEAVVEQRSRYKEIRPDKHHARQKAIRVESGSATRQVQQKRVKPIRREEADNFTTGVDEDCPTTFALNYPIGHPYAHRHRHGCRHPSDQQRAAHRHQA